MRMKPRLLLSAAAFLLLGSSPIPGGSASWAVKKLAGSQWRNGNRMIAEALGRGHTEIKGLLSSMPPAYQEQYKQLAEHYADSAEARAKAASPSTAAALEEHMAHLRKQAELLLSNVLGPSAAMKAGQQQQHAAAGAQTPHQTGSAVGASGADPTGTSTSAAAPGIGDAILDPLQQQMLKLQQRQQQEMQHLIKQMQQSQQEERIRLEQQLRRAREQHLAVQRENNSIRSSLLAIQKGLEEVQARIRDFSGGETVIEELTGRLEAALRRVSSSSSSDPEAGGAGGGGPSALLSDSADLLQPLDGSIYLQTKARLGRSLGDINAALQRLTQQIGQAEARATDLAEMGASGAQLSEQLLLACASFRVSLSSQEEYLREVVAVLETKQIACDATFERLKTALDAAYSRYAGALKGRALELQQEISSAAENLKLAAATGSQQIRSQIEQEIQRVSVNGVTSQNAAMQKLQMLQQYAMTWTHSADQSLAVFEGLIAAGQQLLATVRSLPPKHAVDVSSLQQAIVLARDAKRCLRQEKAKLQHYLRILEGHYRERLQQQQQQLLQQQMGPSLGPVAADPYAAYALPPQLLQQQQQQQNLQQQIQGSFLPQAGFLGGGPPSPPLPVPVGGAAAMPMGAPGGIQVVGIGGGAPHQMISMGPPVPLAGVVSDRGLRAAAVAKKGEEPMAVGPGGGPQQVMLPPQQMSSTGGPPQVSKEPAKGAPEMGVEEPETNMGPPTLSPEERPRVSFDDN